MGIEFKALEELREEILKLADEDYRQFQQKLLPEVKNFAGVRLPALRKLAKQIAGEGAQDFLDIALERNREEELFEEIMLQGMVIGYWKKELPIIFSYTDRFLEKIDNWSVCDSFCSGLKCVKANQEEAFQWIIAHLHSDREFEVRFGVVMLLNYYITDDYIERLFPVFDYIGSSAFTCDGYYVKMAVAWAVSVCYMHYRNLTEDFLKNNRLDDFTFHKSLQKITESHRVAAEDKERIRKMRRRKDEN